MDSKLAANIVLYDWLSFTSKVHSPDDLISALGLDQVPWSDTKGAHGYRSRKYFSCISIHYDGRDDMGVWVEMSGQGCRAFETFSSVSWPELFTFITDNSLNITRLDVAFDDHTGILDIGQIGSDTICGLYVSKSDYWEVLNSSKGSTVQIGSPKSKIVIRIYDKAAERGKTDQHWIRCEMQLRDDRAREFMKLSLPIGQAFTGVLLNYLRYVIPDEHDVNKWRWDLQPYWKALVEDARRISIYSDPGVEYNATRAMNYVFNQSGNAIDAIIKGVGVDEFISLLDKRSTKPNPKYNQVVYELQQLMADSAALALNAIVEERYKRIAEEELKD